MSELSYWINDDTAPADAVARARQVDSDEWIEFQNHFYQSCCDCGLTHRINIRDKTVGSREVQFVRLDEHSALMRERLGKQAADALDAQAQEIARLTHDIERHVAIASEHATECETLRARLSEATNGRRPWLEQLTAAEIIRAFRANELGEPGDAVYQTGAADLIEQLTADLADYQANVSESMDRTIAYEAELKADRDKWRKLCQDGWVEVADGPISRRLREDLASFMMSHGFATGHGDSHTDLLGELGPQIDDLRARLEAAEKDAGRYRWLRGNSTDRERARLLSDCLSPNGFDAAIDAERGGT